MKSTTHDQGKEGILQIYKYLQAIDQLKNPVVQEINDQPWRLWFKDLPQYQTVIKGDGSSKGYVLIIKRPVLDEPKQWTEKGKNPAREAMEIYNQFFQLYARLERESEQYELVLGDGILTWDHSTGLIHHPILLQRLKLEFNPSVPEFILSETEHPVELYTALFRSVTEVNGTLLNRIQEKLEENHIHPLGGRKTQEYFKRIITQLSPYGQFLKSSKNTLNIKTPYLVRDPLIFLRKRSLGFSKAIEEIIADIPERSDLPEFLENIVGIDKADQKPKPKEYIRPIDPNGEDAEILLSKSANAEQLQIADRLNRFNAVLVQGPPGTGKTHTIANLIGHLLAQGKSVLVTSHTSKALSVLHEKIVEPLQPLCLSVLADDSRSQLESAIDAITERLSNSDPDILERESIKLQKERIELLKKLREARQELLEARADEYRPLSIANEKYTPIEAAKWINRDMDKYKWLPGPVRPGARLPLSNNELKELYRTNISLNKEDENELSYPLPNSQKLPLPHEFEQIVTEFQDIANSDIELGKEYWDPKAKVTIETLNKLLKENKDITQFLHTASEWQLTLIQIGTYGEEHLKPWYNLLDQIENLCTKSTDAQEILYEYNPTVAQGCISKEMERVIQEIIHHLQKGKSISFLKRLTKRNWQRLIQQVKINGQPPEELKHFEVLKIFVEIRNSRQKLLDRWERQVTVIGGPGPAELGEEPEFSCRQFSTFICKSLEWLKEVWNPFIERLRSSGFRWEEFYDEISVRPNDYGQLERIKRSVDELNQILSVQIKRLRYTELAEKLLTVRSTIEKTSSTKAHVTQNLVQAILELNTTRYRQAHERLIELNSLSKDLKLRTKLLRRLEKDAPGWAALIQNREGIHGKGKCPANPSKAWLWRQFVEELDYRSKKSMEELMNKITYLSQELRTKTALLVEKKAWAAQVRRTTVPQRQALNGWKQLMHRIGKGTGKRVPELLAEARKLMPICQSAVPVWIMPLSRVVESFNPRINKFDVVIIDEASQADVLALTALYMGKQVVIVGDNEQVSPAAVGQKIEETEKLIDEHLQGIPNRKLYDGLFSIYDLAGTVCQPICLREHFRSVAPIIQFSNYLSYDGKIIPLRDESTVKIRPHTVAYRVKGGTSHNKINEKEAEVIASLIIACTEQPEYKDATIGVISLVGDEQANIIDRLLQQHLPAKEYKRRRIQCGNPAHFQGDERDIIFLSMVDSSGEGVLSRKGEGANDMYKKRFNVAASRARDQMWVIHSMDPDMDLKPGDIRAELIKHAQEPRAIMKMLDTVEKTPESELEKQILLNLRKVGYTVHPQWKVGSYRIGMVVENNGKRVAIECDGDKWHTLDNLAEDMSRQGILERLGWRFIRVRGSEYFRDPEKTIGNLIERLREYEVIPESSSVEKTVNSAEDFLKNKVIERAESIRKQWSGEEKVVDVAADVDVKVTSQEEKAPLAVIAHVMKREPERVKSIRVQS